MWGVLGFYKCKDKDALLCRFPFCFVVKEGATGSILPEKRQDILFCLLRRQADVQVERMLAAAALRLMARGDHENGRAV